MVALQAATEQRTMEALHLQQQVCDARSELAVVVAQLGDRTASLTAALGCEAEARLLACQGAERLAAQEAAAAQLDATNVAAITALNELLAMQSGLVLEQERTAVALQAEVMRLQSDAEAAQSQLVRDRHTQDQHHQSELHVLEIGLQEQQQQALQLVQQQHETCMLDQSSVAQQLAREYEDQNKQELQQQQELLTQVQTRLEQQLEERCAQLAAKEEQVQQLQVKLFEQKHDTEHTVQQCVRMAKTQPEHAAKQEPPLDASGEIGPLDSPCVLPNSTSAATAADSSSMLLVESEGAPVVHIELESESQADCQALAERVAALEGHLEVCEGRVLDLKLKLKAAVTKGKRLQEQLAAATTTASHLSVAAPLSDAISETGGQSLTVCAKQPHLLGVGAAVEELSTHLRAEEQESASLRRTITALEAELAAATRKVGRWLPQIWGRGR